MTKCQHIKTCLSVGKPDSFFVCCKGKDLNCNVVPRKPKRTITVKAESWNGWFIKLPKELSCKAGVPCTVTFNKKYLKG